MICAVQQFPLLGLSLMVLENKAWINDILFNSLLSIVYQWKKYWNKWVDYRQDIWYRKNIISTTNLRYFQSRIKCHFVEYCWKSKDVPHTRAKLMAVNKQWITVLYLEKAVTLCTIYICLCFTLDLTHLFVWYKPQQTIYTLRNTQGWTQNN